MSKRPDRDEASGQADLFGAATPPPTNKKKPRPRQRVAAFASASFRSPSALTSKGASTVVGNGLLNVRQAATRLGLSKSTLDKMRCAGKGPRFIKSTDRAIRYDPADLDAWITDRRRTSTAQN